MNAADVFEGIYDMGAGLVGEIGGWFSEDFKKAVTDHIDDDWTGGIEKTLDDLGLEHSYLNEEGVGEFVGGVARGVGGLLPAVAVTAAASYFSGGTLTAPTIQALGLGTTIGGAAGQSTEEALNEGASLGKALNYGVLSGAVEGVTEKLVGGPTSKIFGKGLLDSGEAVAKTGAKRIFKDMLGEGIEEGIATAVNPLLKTTYKGAEALGEYTEPEFLGDVLRDAASGAMVSAAFGNTVGRIMHTSGKDADIADSIEAIKNNNKEGARLVAENGALTESEEAKLRENKLKNIANIENALQSVSDEKRAKLIERHNLKSLFDESGKISPDFKAELMGSTVEAPNAQTNAVEDGTGGSVPSGGVDRRYASYGLWGKQKTVDEDLAAMTEDYRKITKDEGARVELYRGELTDAESEAFASARRAINKLSDRTATGIELALIEGSSDSTRVNGVMKGNTVYLSKESLADGSWAETTVEEVSHFSEGTESYRKVIKFLAKDERFADAVLNSLTAEGNPYGFTKADVDSILKKLGTRNANVLDRRSSEGYNVSAQFALGTKKSRGFTKTHEYKKITNAEREDLWRELLNLYHGIGDGFADGIAMERGNVVYIIDSGRENGKLDFGVRERRTISNAEKRQEYIKEKNDEAISKGNVSDSIFERIGNGYGGHTGSDLRREHGSNRSNSHGESGNNAGGISGEIRGSGGGISDKAEFSLKSTSDGAQADPVDSEASNGEELTEKERMLINEVRAHLSAEALGSEAFMRRIIESDASLAEKLLNRIKSLKNAFAGSKDPSVRAQSTRLSKAEKLWLKAVDDAGYKYAAGKIVRAMKEKERQDEDVTRMNAEKVQDGERYSYDTLTKKNDISVVTLPTEIPMTVDGEIDKKAVVAQGKLNAKKQNNPNNTETNTYVHVDDIGLDVLLGAKGLQHGLARSEETALAVMKIGDILKGSVAVNEMNGSDTRKTDMSYVLLGTCQDGDDLYVVRSVVSKLQNNVTEIDVYQLGAVKGKKTETPNSALKRGAAVTEQGSLISSGSPMVSIADLLQYVKDIPMINEIFSKDVAKRLGVNRSVGTLSPDIRFSLSSKQESDGARAKANANRHHSKTYTRAEAAAIMNAVEEGATDAEGNPIRIKGQKGKIIDALWERLNKVDENSGKRGGMALDIANHMIRASVVEDLEYDPSEEVYLERLDALNGYRNKLDLSSLRGEIKHAYDDKSGRVYLTWSQKDGGMTPDQIKEELAERGIVIEADNPADILFEMDRMYTEAREYFKQKTNARLSDWMNADELNAYRQSLAQKILKETVGKGSTSNLARDYQRREADFKRRAEGFRAQKEVYEERIARRDQALEDAHLFMEVEKREMIEGFHAASTLVYKVGKLRKQLTDGIKKQHSVKSFNDPRFKGSLGKLTGMTRAGQLLDKNTRKIFASVNEWYTKENELFRDHSTDDGKIEPNRYYNEEVKACIDALAKGKGRLTGDDIKRADLAVSYFSKLIESYNMVYRNGRYVDAVEIAKKNIENIGRVKKQKRGVTDKIFQLLKDVMDPATVMRYADGYRKGFFTSVYEDLRQGCMKTALLRAELGHKYQSFFETHNKYENRLAEEVEFRGHKIPRNVLISLYMTSKREHSHKGLVESGYVWADKKTNDSHKLAPLGDPAAKYSDAEALALVKALQTDIEGVLDSTDLAYIKHVEDVIGECAKLKIETDNERQGRTNVDLDSYYYPIVRSSRPINLDSDSILEAMERVNNLSMNKDTVKGANAMLYIDTVDAVILRHINQVSIYNGLSIAVDNFNKLANLNINDGPGVPVTVNTELDTGFGKYAMNYLRTLKNDIEGMHSMSETDRTLDKLIGKVRGAYATSVLGANPKVWFSQYSSVIAANNVLDGDCIARGIAMSFSEARRETEEHPNRIEAGMSEEKLHKNAKAVLKMKNVSELSGQEFADDGATSLKDRVINFFDSFGNSAVHPELGAVSITKSSFRDDKAHGLTRQKVISFAAIPEVIAKGRIIDVWKPDNKPYQRITVAAPITIAGEKYYMGVMIQRDNQSQRMYLHDVITEKATSSFNTEPTTQKSEGIRDEGHLFITSILRKALNVNNEFYENNAKASKKVKEVDKYCPLAKLRHEENTVVEAQSVAKRAKNAAVDVLMKPIGWSDRNVIYVAWGACQAQVEKNGGPKVGTEENSNKHRTLLCGFRKNRGEQKIQTPGF